MSDPVEVFSERYSQAVRIYLGTFQAKKGQVWRHVRVL